MPISLTANFVNISVHNRTNRTFFDHFLLNHWPLCCLSNSHPFDRNRKKWHRSICCHEITMGYSFLPSLLTTFPNTFSIEFCRFTWIETFNCKIWLEQETKKADSLSTHSENKNNNTKNEYSGTVIVCQKILSATVSFRFKSLTEPCDCEAFQLKLKETASHPIPFG